MQYHTGDFFCPSWMCYYSLHVCCWHYLLGKRIIFSTWLKLKTFNLKLIIIFHFKRASLPTQRHYTYRLLEKVIRLRCCRSLLLPATLALSWDRFSIALVVQVDFFSYKYFQLLHGYSALECHRISTHLSAEIFRSLVPTDPYSHAEKSTRWRHSWGLLIWV